VGPTGRMRRVRDAFWRTVCVLVGIAATVLGVLNVAAFAIELLSSHDAMWANLGLGALFMAAAAGTVWLFRHPEIGDW